MKATIQILPTLTIAAKNLATEMTNHNVQQADLQGEPAITREHIQNNTSVSKMLVHTTANVAPCPNSNTP